MEEISSLKTDKRSLKRTLSLSGLDFNEAPPCKRRFLFAFIVIILFIYYYYCKTESLSYRELLQQRSSLTESFFYRELLQQSAYPTESFSYRELLLQGASPIDPIVRICVNWRSCILGNLSIIVEMEKGT